MSESGCVKYRYLGKSGLKVPDVCLGTMTFGERKGAEDLVQCTEAEAHALLDYYVSCGGNFIDTANVYQLGKSEEIIGNWLMKQSREKLVIASKVRSSMDPSNENGIGLSRVHIMRNVEESLRRLRTDYLDLYQIHCWDDAVPVEETLSALNDLVHQGKIRYLGVSNVTGWQLQKMVDLTTYNRWAPIVSLQQQWNLLSRQTEWELIDVCRNEGVGILPWSPLKGGWLSGKYQRDMAALPKDSRIMWTSSEPGRANQSHPSFEQFNTQHTWNLLSLMKDTAKIHGKTVAQVALRWLLDQDTVSSVVIGAKTMAQLKDNMGASGNWHLTPEQMSALDKASAVDIPYPYEMIFRVNKDRRRATWNN